jgi:hypothetical protein
MQRIGNHRFSYEYRTNLKVFRKNKLVKANKSILELKLCIKENRIDEKNEGNIFVKRNH